MAMALKIRGFVESEGRILERDELEAMLFADPRQILDCGGEFFLQWDGCMARDHLGIVPGDCPPGSLIGRGRTLGQIVPPASAMDLGEAIQEAVRLRATEGVVAMSGGVDSALVACLARRPCVAVGLGGSHDLRRAAEVAGLLGLSLERVEIDAKEIEGALARVLPAIPEANPVDASIATTLYFVARFAGENGYRRVLAGQGADELFAGYARYLESETLEEDLERDFQRLAVQLQRDQAVASLHATCFSLPYLDLRVVNAARSIPAREKVKGQVRKAPLREVACRFMPREVACYQKKAMQYGSGVWREIQRLARRRGHASSVQSYLDSLAKDGGAVAED
ncbi:MAG: asparagine synthetase B [Methanosarcinales archaeon]|nr:asparagine synthetase B [Methanosarcinales archaeon]